MSDLKERLIGYCETDYYPFHMPGHKRQMQDERSPFFYDITEIEGFDNLHKPEGILRIAMEEAAKFYGADRTYFMVNGSTGGLLSAISAVTDYGDEILIARNCHKSVYNALYLRGLRQWYICPEYVEEYGISGGISVEKLRQQLKTHPNVKAVVITSPTYEGVVSHIEEIALLVHQYGIPLIVDEAHGAHFGLHESFPKSAITLGADIVIQSLHKTLPALTQAALLHVKFYKGVKVERGLIEQFLSIYQTTSPSYVLMASIDECINKIINEGVLLFEPYVKRLEVIKQHAKQLTHLRLVDREILGKNAVYGFDLSKLVISCRGTEITGQQLYDKLSKEHHLQLEMAAGDYAVAMTSVMDTEEGLLRLFTALAEVDRDLRISGGEYQFQLPQNREETESELAIKEFAMPDVTVLKGISEAMHANQEVIPFTQAAGRISANYVYLYPPGIPVIAPGDLISAEVTALVLRYQDSGLRIHGWIDEKEPKISVVQEEFQRIQFWR